MAGYSFIEKKDHRVGAIVVWISPIRLAANDLNFLLGFFIKYNTYMLPLHKAYFFITWSSKTLDNFLHKCIPNILPSNSNWRELGQFSGATSDLEAITETDTDQSSYTFLSYMTAA